MKNLGYYNGKYDLIENMTVPMNDRACYFGDGLYEAVYTRNYIMYALDEHMDRLYDSAEKLGINIPHTKEEFIDVLADIDYYESYCRDHPDYKNNRAVFAIANIGKSYTERLEKHDFLT